MEYRSYILHELSFDINFYQTSSRIYIYEARLIVNLLSTV